MRERLWKSPRSRRALPPLPAALAGRGAARCAGWRCVQHLMIVISLVPPSVDGTVNFSILR
jgi:hypothetical protein